MEGFVGWRPDACNEVRQESASPSSHTAPLSSLARCDADEMTSLLLLLLLLLLAAMTTAA